MIIYLQIAYSMKQGIISPPWAWSCFDTDSFDKVKCFTINYSAFTSPNVYLIAFLYTHVNKLTHNYLGHNNSYTYTLWPHYTMF